jgi:large subunit ribosomal protein L35Ae
MEGVISSYRRGIKTQTMNQAIILVAGVESKKDAEKLIGKTASWETSGKEKRVLTGKITAAHGSNGAVRVLFDKGVPGQALGTKILIK